MGLLDVSAPATTDPRMKRPGEALDLLTGHDRATLLDGHLNDNDRLLGPAESSAGYPARIQA